MDRMDLFINVPNLKFEKLISPDEENSSIKMKEKITKTRVLQEERFKQEKNTIVNAEMDISQIKKYCGVDDKSKEILKRFVDSGKLSARGYHRILKTARTIADLDTSENIKYDHITEALMYRINED